MVGTTLDFYLTNVSQQVFKIIKLAVNVSNYIVLSTDLNDIWFLNEQLNDSSEEIF